jgi:hypothetical protein
MTARRFLTLVAAGVAAGWLVGRVVDDVAHTHNQLRAHVDRVRVPAPRRTGLMPPFDQDGGR